MLEKGYTQLYTGNGKGKSTAAFGLALRAAGAGHKTIIIQFMKGQHYSELDAFAMLNDSITCERYGSEKFCRLNDESWKEHKRLCDEGYRRAGQVLQEEYSIIILDEIVTTTLFSLLTDDDIISLINKKPETKELILTGRGASTVLVEAVDLATEMKEIKHYYQNGVSARKGIEF